MFIVKDVTIIKLINGLWWIDGWMYSLKDDSHKEIKPYKMPIIEAKIDWLYRLIEQ